MYLTHCQILPLWIPRATSTFIIKIPRRLQGRDVAEPPSFLSQRRISMPIDGSVSSLCILIRLSDICITLASYQIYALKPDVQSEQTLVSQSPLMNWSDAYPAVQSADIPKMSIEDVAALIRDPAQKKYAVIDVRRNDHAVSHSNSSKY